MLLLSVSYDFFELSKLRKIIDIKKVNFPQN